MHTENLKLAYSSRRNLPSSFKLTDPARLDNSVLHTKKSTLAYSSTSNMPSIFKLMDTAWSKNLPTLADKIRLLLSKFSTWWTQPDVTMEWCTPRTRTLAYSSKSNLPTSFKLMDPARLKNSELHTKKSTLAYSNRSNLHSTFKLMDPTWLKNGVLQT